MFIYIFDLDCPLHLLFLKFSFFSPSVNGFLSLHFIFHCFKRLDWCLSARRLTPANPRAGFGQGDQTNNIQQIGIETKDTNGLFGFCSVLEQAVF